MSPVPGGLSDRFGRRPVLLVSLATLGVDYLVMAVAPTLWLLFLGRAVAGVAGATYATATAYIADVTPREGRAAAFGLVGAGFGVGFVLGPAIGGLIGDPSVWSYYAKEAFAWSNAQIGLSLAAVGIGFAVVQGGLIRIFLARLGERLTGYLGFALNFAGMVGIGIATQGWMIYALMPITALGDITKPALSGLISNRVADDAQGELQGVLSSTQSVMTVVSLS